MQLALIADDGTIVDTSDDFTREEFLAAQRAPMGAVSLLSDLNANAS